MKKLLFLLLFACTASLLYAQDFWQQLTPIEGDYKVQHLATNTKGILLTTIQALDIKQLDLSRLQNGLYLLVVETATYTPKRL